MFSYIYDCWTYFKLWRALLYLEFEAYSSCLHCFFIGIGFTFHSTLNNNPCHNLSQSLFYSLHTVASVLGKLTFCETVVQDSCLNIGLRSNAKESYQNMFCTDFV